MNKDLDVLLILAGIAVVVTIFALLIEAKRKSIVKEIYGDRVMFPQSAVYREFRIRDEDCDIFDRVTAIIEKHYRISFGKLRRQDKFKDTLRRLSRLENIANVEIECLLQITTLHEFSSAPKPHTLFVNLF